MTLLVFVAICAAGSVLGLLAQPFPKVARIVGLAGLAAAFASALFIGAADTLTAGQVDLFASWYGGLFLTVAAVVSLGLCLLGLTSGWPERFAPAVLATLGGLAIALSATDPSVALVAAAASASPAVLVAARAGRLSFLADVRLAELRTLALIVAGAMFAAVVALVSAWNSDDPTPVVGLAILGLGVALAVRSGAVPFHVPAARFSRTSNRLAPALALVLIPAGLGLVAVSWSVGTYGFFGDWLNGAVGVIQAIAVMTLILGAVGALLHDQVEEIGAYSIVQDAAFVLLAFAARDPGVEQPTRIWLLVFVAAKSGLLAWVAATSWAFGSSSLTDLRGWLRRAPILGLALLAVVVATVGWPGNPVFEARSTLVRLGLPSQLGLLGPIAMLLSLAYYARLFGVGLLTPGDGVQAADGERPRWPARSMVEGAAARQRGAADLAREIPGALRLNRTIRASLVALALGVLAVTLSVGGFGASGAVQTGIALDQTFAQGPTGPGDNTAAAPSAGRSPLPGELPSDSPDATRAGSSASGSPSTGPSAPTAAPSPSASPTPTGATPSPSAVQTTGD